MFSETQNPTILEQTAIDPSTYFRPMSEFTSSAGAEPFNYPGNLPEYSFFTDGTNVMRIFPPEEDLPADNDDANEGYRVYSPESDEIINLDEYLESRGVPALEDRIPVIAYGANRNPRALFGKFNKGAEGDPRLAIVPVIMATRHGSEVAWSKEPGTRGRPYADMVTDEVVADSEVQVAVSFLTHDQLAIMHSGESLYDIIEEGEVVLDDGTEDGIVIPGLYYSALSGEVYGRKKEGTFAPVAVESIKANGRYGESYTAQEAVQSVLDTMVNNPRAPEWFSKLDSSDAEVYMKFFHDLSEEDRKVFRGEFATYMDDEGLKYEHFRPEKAKKHEWNFNFLPTYGQLLSLSEYDEDREDEEQSTAYNDAKDRGVQGAIFTNDLVKDEKVREKIEAKVIGRSPTP